jgi:hypothetical protein
MYWVVCVWSVCVVVPQHRLTGFSNAKLIFKICWLIPGAGLNKGEWWQCIEAFLFYIEQIFKLINFSYFLAGKEKSSVQWWVFDNFMYKQTCYQCVKVVSFLHTVFDNMHPKFWRMIIWKEHVAIARAFQRFCSGRIYYLYANMYFFCSFCSLKLTFFSSMTFGFMEFPSLMLSLAVNPTLKALYTKLWIRKLYILPKNIDVTYVYICIYK